MYRTAYRRLCLLAVAGALALSSAWAGGLNVLWDASSGATGYRLYYGTSPTTYATSVDVGNTTQTTLNGLTDCTTYYFAATAYNAGGESGYSNQASSWPRPVLSTALPASAEQGRSLSVVLAGTNFQAGSTIQLSNPNVTVSSVTINSCNQITLNLAVGATAAPGAVAISVTHANGLQGSAPSLFTVTAAVAPTVGSTTPTDGATGVAVNVQPTVTFSEPMLAASIGSTTVRLLDESGNAVSQAGGSPSLNGAGTVATIVPAANLQQGRHYRIQVVGGASGVRDLANLALGTTFTQATGFLTVDTTAPTISAVAASGVNGTSATIGWTTNEAATSQVFFRRNGETVYQQTALDTNNVTTHSVALTGLYPSTTYQYHVTSVDPAGNAATSTPDQTLTTTASPYAYLQFEAESGTLVSPVREQPGTDAFGGAFIDTPTGSGSGSATSPLGTATYGFLVPNAGTWRLWVRLQGISSTANAWFESIDGAARQAIAPSADNVWTWVAGRSYTLSTGLHSLELGGSERRARADRILLTDDPNFVPSEQPGSDVTPPASVTAFSATAGDASVTLGWTNPTATDFAQTVIRFRTDGKFPVSPVDGFAVTSAAGAPGSTGSFLHNALTNGTVYSYSAFALDASGNVADRATATATPVGAPQPPPPPQNLDVY
ncbi:MAG TPA: Ig-like domain-containing protein [Candidatus Polarisedimenticolaceae bacterium]|nr:Ig-like domain-containing protein [Candidatus Polarisedimenticolaceae bacterium]